MDFTIQIRGTEEWQRLLRSTPGEMRRATRNLVNDLARAAQAMIRERAAGPFDVQRPAFLKRSIYIGPEDKATSEKLIARVRMHPDASSQVYTQHDISGPGTKAVRVGRNLVIPARGIRTTGGHVQRGMRFADFKPFATVGGSASLLRKRGDQLVHRGTKTLRSQVVGRKQSFFVTLRGPGLTALMQRVRGQSAPRLLYVLKPAVRLPPRFEFHRWATEGVDRSFQRLVERELANAMRRLGMR